MGRAGSSGGGGRSSGGGHSSSRSSGGHRPGSSSYGGSSRAGSGSYRSSSARGHVGTPPPRYGYGPGAPPPPPRYGYGYGPVAPPPPRSYGYGRRSRRGSFNFLSVFILFMIAIAVITAFGSTKSSYAQTGSRKSTTVREKLNTSNAYINDCIIDELGWFDNISKTSSSLKAFWEETGVQPYIILKDYDPALTSDSAEEQWAVDYYDNNFDTENIFLYVYFAEADVENDVGYMCYANGKQTSSIMDSEAIEIFWNNIDRYWFTDLSTDDVFIKAFTQTGSTIMHVSTTGKDITKWVLIVSAIILIGVFAVVLVSKRNKRAKEEEEERQRILNTPIHDMADDELENKYLK